MGNKLRYGYTTGACAAGAAKAAAQMLRTQQLVEEIAITLPRGEVATFKLQGQAYSATSATCFIVKDAGSDPDVTHGAEIHAVVTLSPTLSLEERGRIIVDGGKGIGRVTKPGLAVPIGGWAINPVPTKMIKDALAEIFTCLSSPSFTLHCLISIPNGAELAKKTLNERLGIIGGLSILGTTGIVTPISAKAWTDTINTAINVALASGSKTVVLSTGRTSELSAQRKINARVKGQSARKTLPEEAFVLMGDYVGHGLRACADKGVATVVLAGQFAKLLKIACGHEQTHVSSSSLDLQQLVEWLCLEPKASSLAPLAQRANTARQVLEESGHNQDLMALICTKALAFAQQLAPGLTVQVLLVGYTGEVLYSAKENSYFSQSQH